MSRTTDSHSDRALVEGCLRNDRRMQELLYRRFFPAMLRMCRRYTDHEEEIIEIINSGFLRVFTKLHLYQFTGSLEGWIRRLIFHSLSDYYRQRDRKLRFIDLAEQDAPTEAGALDGLYYEDLLRLIEQLPAMSREVFWLFAVDGYSHQEIGDRLGISEGTSKWHVSNARQKLKAMILQPDHKSRYAT